MFCYIFGLAVAFSLKEGSGTARVQEGPPFSPLSIANKQTGGIVMCEFCDRFGDGTSWYLQPKNYARSIYKMKETGKKSVSEAIEYRKIRDALFTELSDARCSNPEMIPEITEKINQLYRDNEPCQVMTLQECNDIVDLAVPMAIMSCICRKVTRAVDERNEDEYSCLGIGVGMFKWERWPERYRGGVKFISPDKAKEWLAKWNKRGLMHCAMVYGKTEDNTPFVGGICNCDYPVCMPMRHRLDYNIKYNLLKGHYVAFLDYDKCNGCGLCAQRCQYGAIKMEVTIKKPNIDMFRCFGCGLCETGCKKNAIEMVKRSTMPALREEW